MGEPENTAAVPALGLRRGTVKVVEFDERWPGLFVEASRELSEALGPKILAVHHVGSTSVPGLCAKPVLDIQVTIQDFDRGLDLVPVLCTLGYVFRADEEIVDRHYFRRGHRDVRTHHLSLAELDSHYHRVTLAFRDALRSDPTLVKEYGTLKQSLARKFPRDRQAYIDGKCDFIARILDSLGY